ncbi:MAG: GNAT family N-acetyltransferase [Phycisphaerales bacterium JB059]
MTRCFREPESPAEGFAWKEPSLLDLRVESARLLLRPYELEDAPLLFDAVNQDRDALLPWLPWARTEHREMASTLNFISGQILRLRKPLPAEGVALGVFDKSSGQLLGGAGFHDLRRDTASVEVGYWVRGDRHRQGICTESTAHWLSRLLAPQDAGGLGLRRVRIYCSADNRASSRVPEKLGLRPEVMQRQDYFVPHHGVTDRLGWGVMHDEWDCENHRIRQ